MIKVGIIGFGKMGRLRAEVISKSRHAKVSLIHDINPSQFEGAKFVSNYDEIIYNKSIDAIFICTPNYLNQPLTIKCLKSGKHVFCEKPPAMNEEEVLEIIKEEKLSGKKLMYGFNHRHHDSIQLIKSHVKDNTYGKILWMRGRYGKSVDKNFYANWRARSSMSGGGILLDQGIHMLDLFNYLSGEFDLIKSFVSNLYWKSDIEDNAFVLLKNSQTGVVASLHSTMTQWRHLFSLEVFLEKGYFVLNGLKTSSGTYGDEILTIAKNRTKAPRATWKDEERLIFKINNSWKSEVNSFIKCVTSEVPIPIGTSNDALIIMRTIDKIYKDGK